MRILILVFFLVSAGAFAADIQPLPMADNSGGYWVAINGEIRKGDAERLRQYVKGRGSFPHHIFVESPGGDALESVRVGKLIRKSLIPTYPGVPCNSGCALIVFASVDRDSDGKVGIHRPYYDKRYFAGLSLEGAKAKYAELDKTVSDYLREMEVPTTVAEKMMTVPSTAIEVMAMKDYVRLAGVSPPAFEEWLIAQCGDLSPQEKADAELLWAKFNHDALAEKMPRLAAEYREKAALAGRLPEGYKMELRRRSGEIAACKKQVIRKEQDAMLGKM